MFPNPIHAAFVLAIVPAEDRWLRQQFGALCSDGRRRVPLKFLSSAAPNA